MTPEEMCEQESQCLSSADLSDSADRSTSLEEFQSLLASMKEQTAQKTNLSAPAKPSQALETDFVNLMRLR